MKFTQGETEDLNGYVTQVRRKGILFEFGVLVQKKKKKKEAQPNLQDFLETLEKVLRTDVSQERSQLLIRSFLSAELSTELKKCPVIPAQP